AFICIDCRSDEDENCATLKTKPNATEKDCGESLCATWIKDTTTFRGCDTEVPEDLILDDKICVGHRCNKEIYPEERLKCVQCSSDEEMCSNPNADILYPCKNFVEDDLCYTFIIDENRAIRGCMSDQDENVESCNSAGDDCIKCNEDFCNGQSGKTSVKCITCSSDEDIACGYSQIDMRNSKNCEALIEQENLCFAFNNETNFLRGCLNDYPELKPSCEENSEDCQICDGDLCNFMVIAEELCYICDSTEDENCADVSSSPAETLCGEVPFDKSGCYLSISNGDGNIKRGCVNSLSDDEIIECQTGQDCKICHGNMCNVKASFQKCFNCNSEIDLNCATLQGGLAGKVCDEYLDTCMVYVKPNMTTHRGCSNELHDNVTECLPESVNCKQCSDNNCNGEIFPVNRLTCFHCHGNDSDCRTNLASIKELKYPCEVYNFRDSCYMYVTEDQVTHRGCLSDLNEFPEMCLDDREKCAICQTPNCNYESVLREPTLSCIECDSTFGDECSWGWLESSAEKCQKEIFFYQEERCHSLVVSDDAIIRGCTLDGNVCTTFASKCDYCTTDGCNRENLLQQYCYDCNSDDDQNCGPKPYHTKNVTCSGIVQHQHRGCYTKVDSQDKVIRGCYSDLSMDERIQCTNEGEFCQRCIDEMNCNNIPKDSVSIFKKMIKYLVFLALCVTLVYSQAIGPGVPDSRCPPGTPFPPIHLPDANNCEIFHTCSGGLAFPQRCPPGQHWSVQHNWCDWPERANCGSGGGGGPPNRCPPGNTVPPVMLPHEYDCSRFYVCSWGQPQPRECPPGLYWSVQNNWCDWPERANCNLRGTTTRRWNTTTRRWNTTTTRRRDTTTTRRGNTSTTRRRRSSSSSSNELSNLLGLQYRERKVGDSYDSTKQENTPEINKKAKLDVNRSKPYGIDKKQPKFSGHFSKLKKKHHEELKKFSDDRSKNCDYLKLEAEIAKLHSKVQELRNSEKSQGTERDAKSTINSLQSEEISENDDTATSKSFLIFFAFIVICLLLYSLNFHFRPKKTNKYPLNMSAWRAAGLNYINYSNIAARLLRRALKPEARVAAVKRDESHIKFTPWTNGKPVRSRFSLFKLTTCKGFEISSFDNALPLSKNIIRYRKLNLTNMHGRLKVRTTAEEAIRRKKEQELKAKAYRNGKDKIFAMRKSGSLDQNLLDLTSKILSVNPDDSTLWNIRRECILKMTSGDDPNSTLFERDLGFTELCLQVQPKSYGAWHHRIWTLENSPEPDWNREVTLCNLYLKKDERNFHCWDYRRYVVGKAKVSSEKELQFCDEKIQKNFSNYSSWHYRSQLLPILYPHKTDQTRPISEEKLKEELELVITAAFTDPNDSSAWFYQRWLLGYSEPELDFAAVKFTKTIAIIAFTKPVNLYDDGIEIVINGIPEVNDSKFLTFSGSKSSTVWIQRGTFRLPDEVNVNIKFDNKICEIKTRRLEGNSLIGIKCPSFGYEFGAVVIDELKNQLESCTQLLEYEPDSKWTLLTAALLMRSIDRFQYHDKTREFLKKLEIVDSLRAGYYKDLGSKWSIENKLKNWIDNNEYLTGIIDLTDLDLTTLHYNQYFVIANDIKLGGNLEHKKF
ncbi:CLUMA_CG013627, isoform A, partial [Clunio marinus]